jgi:hypothetical protein
MDVPQLANSETKGGIVQVAVQQAIPQEMFKKKKKTAILQPGPVPKISLPASE